MHLPEPRPVTFPSLVAEIEKGAIKIPQFQREFVWTRLQSARLIDSIIKGYPIGTFILWKTQERLRAIRNLGAINLPEPPKGDAVSYVLDGQQRLTSLFVSLKALQVELADGIRDYAQMHISLVADEDQDLVFIDEVDEDDQNFILLSRLLEGDFQYLGSFPKPQQAKISLYKNRIESYQFSVIEVRDAPIDVATEIFTRLNIGGKALSVFEIMVAKTYDHEKKFDLAERVSELDSRLTDCGFGAIPNATVLQAVAACLGRDITKKAILKLGKAEIIRKWSAIEDALLTAVDYLRDHFHVPVSRLLPFPVLLVPFTYFFYRTGRDRPTPEQRRLLKDFFWRVSLGARYSQGMEGRVNSDLKKIDRFIQEKSASYEWPVDTSAEFITNNGYFKAGRSFIKAILCLFASRHPKSFNTGAEVNIRNNWLKQVNSKNYHHFFPRSYMARHSNEDEFFVNHVANITFVDDHLNKRVIGSKPPSEYLSKFKKENPDLILESILKTHFIDGEKFGVFDDDYEKFFTGRVKMISQTLTRQIIRQEIDRQEVTLIDDEALEDEEDLS